MALGGIKTRRTACAIGKGGPGKTTTALALATGIPTIYPEGKTLLVDYDPQGNSSYVYQADVTNSATIYHVFAGEATIEESIQHTAQGDIIPANQWLTKIEGIFDDYLAAVDKLGEELDKLEGKYTHIIIDNQPLIGGLLTTQALAAANDLVIPVSADVFSLQGLERLQQAIASIRRRVNPDLKVAGILLNKFNPRHTLSSDLLASLKQWAAVNDTKVFDVSIRESVTVRESQTLKQSLFEYAPTSNPALDFMAFIKNEYLRV